MLNSAVHHVVVGAPVAAVTDECSPKTVKLGPRKQRRTGQPAAALLICRRTIPQGSLLPILSRLFLLPCCSSTATIQPPLAIETPSSVPRTGPPSFDSNLTLAARHRERGGSLDRDDADFSPPLHDATAYELDDYRPIQTRKDARDRALRRRQKRLRKRQWLDERDDMKFSHSIQFNAVPDWSSHYIAYSNLKKLIYQLEKSVHQSRAGDSESRPLIAGEDPEDVFSKALDIELEKICSFYVAKEGELLDEVAQLLRDIGDRPSLDGPPILRRVSLDGHRGNSFPAGPGSDDEDDIDSASDDDETTGLTKAKSANSGRRKTAGDVGHHHDMAASEQGRLARRHSNTFDYGDASLMFASGLYSSAIMLKKRIASLYVQLCELKSYVQLNKTGFGKVLKKFDKILDKELKAVYIRTHVDTAYPFRDETKKVIDDNITKMESAYADVVTGGDAELAKKDLRSHLREHVVWERNTVWRDLIGIERRAEAARFGQSLLGQDQSAAPKRLQGDDGSLPSHKQFRTPLGRLSLPTWLANGSMLTLIASIAIFLAILFVPILEKPEQQNCLALLVFVSILWATETIPLFVTSLLIPFLSVILRVVREEEPGKPQVRLDSKEATQAIFASMWTPVIMLLLGGFTLAAALSKCKIDKRLATLILSKAGTLPKTVLIANMFVAAFASMLISNVAAPVLCYSIIEPMLRTLPSDSNMSKAVIIGIALASNIGGMLSPIASPQNVVAMGIMQPEPTWLQWFFIVIPVGAVSLVLIWLLLLVTFQPGKGTTIAPIRPLKETFTGVQCHQMEGVFGDMGVIAIMPIVLFFGIGVLTKEDFNNFPWTIIILAAGGLSLGKAVRSSGLLHLVAEVVSQKVEGMSLYGVLAVFSTLILVIATFISHTVAALIFLPLVFDVGAEMDQPRPNLLVMGGVLMCSAAMGLPTSGFPNMTAIMKEDAAGQRYLQVKHFISRGVPSSVMTLAVVMTLGGAPNATTIALDFDAGRYIPAPWRDIKLEPFVESCSFHGRRTRWRLHECLATVIAAAPSWPASAMLSAFTARPIIELRQRDRSKIETILAHGDRILVGLNSGALRVYRLNDLPSPQHDSPSPAGEPSLETASTPQRGQDLPSQAPGKPTDLLREVDRFSTRAIEQLAIIKEANTIVSLSNYHVSLYDLQTYELIETLSRSKNASCFAVTSNIVKDPDTGIPEIISRLAVAVKRRLLLWSWHESELGDEVKEIVLSEAVRTVTWTNATKLVCGMNGGYVTVDSVTQQFEDIVSPGTVGAGSQGSRFGAVSSAGMGYMGLGGYMPKPLAAKLADGEILLAKDINTLFIKDDGKPLERRQIPWPSAPESIGYSYPYIVALQPPSKGFLEVRNPDTLSLLQSISLPGAAQLHFPPPTVSLAHAGKGFHISSERCVWKMAATGYDSQVQELIEGGKFDEAISVLNMLEDALLKDKKDTLREVKMLKAEMLFKQKKYRQAMDLMNEDDVHAPPERVLGLYPPQIAGELSHWARQDAPESSEGFVEHLLPQPMGGFAKLFRGSHKKNQPDVASIASPKKEAAEEDDTESAKESSAAEDKPLDGKDLTKAVLELNSYLAGTRARLQRVIDPVTGKLKPQLDRQGSAEEVAERFLRTTQSESEQKLEEELCNTFRLVDTTLFRSYMLSQPLLAGSLFRIPNFCDPEVVKEKLWEHNRFTELVDFFYGKKLHREALDLLHKFGSADEPDEAAPTLHGPDRTIQYLQNLPPSAIDLILEHAAWTLKSNPSYAMEIFVGDTENAETLPRDQVISFLQSVDTSLERQYLEHIINELDDMTPDFHNRLVDLYVKNLGDTTRGGEWDSLMDKCIRFLRDSRQVYSLTKALGLMPQDDAAFYEARAVVLSNMGEHREALEIYVFKMKDFIKAEEYCNRLYKAQETTASPSNDGTSLVIPEDATKSIYHTLLSLYLKPPRPHKEQLEPALDLLSKHGSRLPATSTMGLIPDDLPVSALEAYFRGGIRSVTSLVNESRVVAGLRKAESISVAARLHLGDDEAGGQGGRNRHVTITDERHCVVCHKKLGGAMRIGGSVVAVLPDNTAVHYGCLSRATGQKSARVRAPSWGKGL
ncbi:SPX domain-containing protein [Hirsutella rhossiliensis]|uniref:SPX domain-containing protein n=1 Tax=Hirsutella rhossiliensis TaxID=111463 RepID=A0A9P8N7Q2_9HYPO|nr:SPX domain-containing protein [Hirsutella rhossiliensis]KAH0968289.1 SPX domain-containing protein [Hirsutella rhossiliensis]